MFARVRLQLTAWYIAILLAIIAIVTGAAYFVLSSALNSEVDDSLRSSASNISSQIEERLEGAARSGDSDSGDDDDDDRGSDDDDDDDRDNEDREVYEDLELFSGDANDVFYLILDRSGDVLLNPLNVSTRRFVDEPAVEEAFDEGEAWRTVGDGDDRTRVLYVEIDGEGDFDAVVEVGRSLEQHQDQLNNLLRVLLITGGGGLLLAALGGFWLSGRALQPTRDAMNRQRQFVSDASHELRTPLTLVRASAEAIQGGSADRLDEADRASIDDIITESDRMAGLVAELLMLAKLEEGRMELAMEHADATSIVTAVAREGEVLASQQGQTVRVEAEEPIDLRCDPGRIGQVLRILIDNAVQHTPGDGSIVLGVRRAGNQAEFWVQDDGPGMAPEHLERIFERFYRIDTPRSRGSGGSGLGLSIARGIVEAHGGKIIAQSKPQVDGTRVSFTLPA